MALASIFLKTLTDISTNHALVQQIEICKYGGPSQHDLSLLRSWLTSPEGNDLSLRGWGCDVWEEHEGRLRDTENDFVVLSSKHRSRDRFERWAGDTLLGIYHRLLGRHFKVSCMTDKSMGSAEIIETFHKGRRVRPRRIR